MTFTMSPLHVTVVMFGFIVPSVQAVCTLSQLKVCVPAFSDFCNIDQTSFNCQSSAENCLRSLSCDRATYSYTYVIQLAGTMQSMCSANGVAGLGQALVCYTQNTAGFNNAFTSCKIYAPNCIPTMAYTNCLVPALKALCANSQAQSYMDSLANALNTYVLFTERGSQRIDGNSANSLHTTVLDKVTLTVVVLFLVCCSWTWSYTT